ncbi:MAG TPA: FecR domain-containing protein [Cytophagales bacterium]|nr:FecR domain-containing protein [Cytophagales bacterium]
MNYLNYSVEDFVLDEDFKKWVKNPTQAQTSFWSEWIKANPGKSEMVESARVIVLSLSIDKDDPFPEELKELWGRIEESNTIHDSKENSRIFKISPSVFYRIAASFVGFVVISALLYYSVGGLNNLSHTTQYGEISVVKLPDGSEVTLNANSTIKFDKHWDQSETREVWLEGEAFFSVTHKENNQKFVVNASDVDVEVLGTEFNVNTRRGKTMVTLNSGKVKLDIENKKEDNLVMKPGEYIEIDEDKKVSKKHVNAERYSSWMKNKLYFSNSSLTEIAAVLEDNYGFDVHFKESSLEKLTFTGVAKTTNIDGFLLVLEKTFDIKITRDENKIVIEK